MFLAEIEWSMLALVFALGVVAFSFSTISGGGGAMILVPVLNFLAGTAKTAPILNLGTFIGRPSRLMLFWKDIDWKVCLYYAPAAIVGAWLSGWWFSDANIEWIKVVVALFLISTILQYRFGKKRRSFAMHYRYFIPLGFIISAISTLVGGMGPVLNPFYLNAGLEKEKLIATKTANSFIMGMSQISSYAFFGLLTTELCVYGLSLGLGATLGNIIGKKILGKMTVAGFRKWLIAFMVLSGVLMLVSLFFSEK